MKLNLETKGKEQELIKAYLEENVSEELARKINAGVFVEQDSKQLINKKTLNGFMKFAGEEARKLAEKGANSACIESDVVFGWAIHYFEEDSIIGELFNPDGTKYVKPKPKTIKSTTAYAPTPPKPKDVQTTMFDLSAFTGRENNEKEGEEVDETEEEVNEIEEETVEEPIKEKPKGNHIYQVYQDAKDSYLTSVIAIRLGDFYEIFGQDAVDIAQELDLTLVGRDCGLETRIPMIGFPYHCADNYFNKIAEKHNVVAINTDGSLTKTIAQIIKEKPEDENEDILKEYNNSCDSPEDEIQKEVELMKAFDKTSLMILLELFEDNATIG